MPRVPNLPSISPGSSSVFVGDDGTSTGAFSRNGVCADVIENYSGSTLAGSAQSVKAAINGLNSKISALSTSTTAASTVADMTDTSKIYVYTGSETGYTNGNWYYYDGSAWVSGGAFNAAGCDAALSDSSTNAVQNKIVNGAIDDLKSALTIEKTLTMTEANWVIGGIGSRGENYSERNTSIRTNAYLNSTVINKLICDDGSLVYVAFYDADLHFINRNAVSGSEVSVRSLNGYDSSALLRLELSNTSITDYEKLKVEYFINGEIEEINGKIEEINGEIEEISVVNGSLANPSNPYIVHTSYIPLKGKTVQLVVDRPIEEEHYYEFSYRVYDDNMAMIRATDAQYDATLFKAYVYDSGAAYIAFNIDERNELHNKVILRKTDFNDYPLKAVFLDRQKYHKNTIIELERTAIIRGYPVNGRISITNTHISVAYACEGNTTYLIQKRPSDRFWVCFCRDNDTTKYFEHFEYSKYSQVEEVTTPAGTTNMILYLNISSVADIDSFVNDVHVTLITAHDQIARINVEKTNSIIEGLLIDNNRNSLWDIGGIGSAGENYNTRTWGIRTYQYLNAVRNVQIEITAGYMIRLAQYGDNNSFISRVIYTAGIISLKNVLKAATKTIRIEIELVDEQGQEIKTPFVDTSAYTGIKLLCPVDFIGDNSEDDKSFDDVYADLISQTRYIYSSSDSGISPYSCLTLLHCTDLHGNREGMDFVLKTYRKYESKIDAILHTGDVVTANLSDGIASWISSGCAAVVLNTIGNHDTEENLVLQAAGKDNVYNTIFAPYISNWGVVQPTDVADSTSPDYHALYYYKDFTTPGVRLIVLDTNFWDAAEKTWLASVLNDALTNSLCVVIACHNVKKLTEMTDSNFSAYSGDGINENTNAYGNQPIDWLDPVKDFMDAGGNFACILAGHNHSGHMGTMTNYPDIFVYVANKSSMNRVSGTARISGEMNQNTVSIVTINPVEKLFKIVKIGAEVDGKMRGRHVFCYDYANKRIISQW